MGSISFTLVDVTGGFSPIKLRRLLKYALTGSEDSTARLWDIASSREIRTFIGHTKAVNSVAFSPDGIYVLTGSDDNTARLWRAETAQEIYTLVGESTRGVINVAFSPDNQYALTLGVGYSSLGQTLLWDVKSGQKIRDFNVGPSINDLGPVAAFSPDSKYLLHGPNFSDVETGNVIKYFYPFMVRSLALSPDRKYVLTGDDDKTVRLWDFTTGQELRTFTQQVAIVRSVAFASTLSPGWIITLPTSGMWPLVRNCVNLWGTAARWFQLPSRLTANMCSLAVMTGQLVSGIPTITIPFNLLAPCSCATLRKTSASGMAFQTTHQPVQQSKCL